MIIRQNASMTLSLQSTPASTAQARGNQTSSSGRSQQGGQTDPRDQQGNHIPHQSNPDPACLSNPIETKG